MLKIKDKIIFYIISKLEFRISKKENKIGCKNNISKRLKLYRDLLNRIDEYRKEVNPDLTIIRHYRYFSFNVDDIKN